MDLQQGFLHHLKQFNVPVNDTTLLAISGGVDSMVLLHLFSQTSFPFAIAHCNFQLRDDAKKEEMLVQKIAKKHSVTVHTKHFDTKQYANNHGLSTQMAARRLRYNWFQKLKTDHHYRYVATAHHLNDSLETVLLNLTKGTGIRGLDGIPSQRGHLIRPLSFATKEQIQTFAQKNDIPYATDQSNQSVDYERNKMRHQVIPLLKELNPNLEQTFTQTLQNLQFANAQYQFRIQKLKRKFIHPTSVGNVIYLKQLAAQPHSEAIFYELVHEFGFSPNQTNDIIEKLFDAKSGATYVPADQSSPYKLVKDRNRLLITKQRKELTTALTLSANQQSVSFGKQTLTQIKQQTPVSFNSKKNQILVDARSLDYPLVIRKWMAGDYFYPLGLNKKQKLKKFFINEKVSIPEKEQTWLLCSNHKIVWVIGRRMDHRFRVKESTKEVVQFQLNA